MHERLFRMSEQASDVRTEVLGGVTTFMTMSYIVIFNPSVLSGTGMDFGAVMTATALFFSPLVRMIGGGVPVEGGEVLSPMTSPALIVVGCLMVANVRRINWEDWTEAFPAFLVMIGIPYTWSIADGIAFGFISYPALKLLSGRAREASALVYFLGLLFVGRYLFL